MATFKLSQANVVNGTQLALEINAACGLNLNASHVRVTGDYDVEINDDLLVGASGLAVVVALHVPVKVAHFVSKKDFIASFSAIERQKIRLSVDANVLDLRDELYFEPAMHVNLFNGKLKAGVMYLESVGLIANGRAVQILDPVL